MSFAWTVKYNLLANLLDTYRQGYHGAIRQGQTGFFEELKDAGYNVHADQSRSDELENNKFFTISQNKRIKLSCTFVWPVRFELAYISDIILDYFSVSNAWHFDQTWNYYDQLKCVFELWTEAGEAKNSFVTNDSITVSSGVRAIFRFFKVFFKLFIIQGHTTTFFCEITVRRSKYCLEISKVPERLKISG